MLNVFTLRNTGPCGGIVFYTPDGGLTGLEVSLDLGTARWGCSVTATGATGLVIGDGAANTAVILGAG